jgi:hypothetical protein
VTADDSSVNDAIRYAARRCGDLQELLSEIDILLDAVRVLRKNDHEAAADVLIDAVADKIRNA